MTRIMIQQPTPTPSAKSQLVLRRGRMTRQNRPKMMNRSIALAWLISVAMAIVALTVSTAEAASLLPPGQNCFFDANGASLKSGTVTFSIVSTTTPKTTWQDSNQTTANTNPVVLSSTTGCAVIYGSGSYREQVKDSLGNLIWDQVVSSPSIAGVSWGGTSTGSANAQVVTASEFQAIDGQVVAFVAGYTNSGATTVTTTNVAATTVVKDTTSGPVALTGSEIIASNVVEMVYSSSDGHFHIVNPLSASGATTNFQSFTTSGTWTKPSGTTSNSRVHLECWGAGGGGSASATGGGGGGGGYSDRWLAASSMGSTETVTIPAGGAINTTGSNATFGSWLTAYGGGGGGNGAAWGGGGGGGESAAGTASAAAAGGVGGGPWLVAAGTSSPSGGGGGTGAATGATGGAGYFGGGGGGGGSSGGASAGGSGGGSTWGCGGGAAAGASGGGGLGTSVWGGAGGASGSAGSQPGGGGGRNAAGGAGQCQATVFP